MTDTLHIRGFWTIDRIAIVHVAAVLPVLAVALYERGLAIVPVLAVALGTVVFWQVFFAWSRHSLVSWDSIVTAVVFVILTPGDVPLFQLALAITFGVVIGEQIFGGRGRGFLSPAATGLVFLFFSFPASATGAASPALGLAALAGAALLVGLGLISWRVLVGAVAGLAAMAAAVGMDLQQVYGASGAFVLAVVYLGCDPVCAASTNIGRLIHGFLVGLLAIVLGYGGGTAENVAAAFAVFLTSIFAPVIDHGIIWVRAIRMRHRDA